MKINKISDFNKEKGITLVALIITIIILLILATISIQLIINAGIINKANYATQKYSIEEQKEKNFLEGSFDQFNNNSGDGETKTYNSYRLDGSIEFNGQNYIDTGLKLFSADNKNKNFEIDFEISSLDENSDLNTILNSMEESSSPWPGFVVRFSGSDNIIIKGNATKEIKKEDSFNKNSVNKVKIKRVGKKIYYIINDGEQVELLDYSDYTRTFETSLMFGCSLDENGTPRRYFKGTLSNINVRIDSDEEYKTVYERNNSITFNGSNYLDTGIKLFNEQNINKNFRIEFNLVEVSENNETQATIMNAKDETGSPWPGFLLRYIKDGSVELLEVSASSTSKTTTSRGIYSNKKFKYKHIN